VSKEQAEMSKPVPDGCPYKIPCVDDWDTDSYCYTCDIKCHLRRPAMSDNRIAEIRAELEQRGLNLKIHTSAFVRKKTNKPLYTWTLRNEKLRVAISKSGWPYDTPLAAAETALALVRDMERNSPLLKEAVEIIEAWQKAVTPISRMMMAAKANEFLKKVNSCESSE